jgi:hypothetical protein
MAQNGPATPSRLHTHSRQISEGNTEFGTPESNFPPEVDSASPSLGESTRMVGLGISRQGSVVSGNGSGDGDVFGGLVRSSRDERGRDAALDEVDQFLQDEEEGDTFDLKHGDHPRPTRGTSKSNSGFSMPRRNDSSHSSLQSHRSHASDPLLEVLDNDDDWEDEEGDMEIIEGDEDEEYEVGAGRRSRRGRRRWNEDEGNGEAGLLEVSGIFNIASGADR